MKRGDTRISGIRFASIGISEVCSHIGPGKAFIVLKEKFPNYNLKFISNRYKIKNIGLTNTTITGVLEPVQR